MRYDIIGLRSNKKRKPFSITKKKIEWMRAGRRDPFGDFVKTSKCRACPRILHWGDRTYEFDHRDNNPANSSQKNCYLVCRVCHGKATRITKRKIKDVVGFVHGYKTIKKKPWYKKPKRSRKKKSRRKTRRQSTPWFMRA